MNDFSLLRICSLGLVQATRSETPAQAVRGLLAMQGQQVSAVPHALTIRLCEATESSAVPPVEQVWRSFSDLDIVRSWPMRGTVHISTRADHHWLRAALMHRYGVSRFSDEELERSADIAGEVIARTGGATRAQLRQAWEEHGLIDAEAEDAAARRRVFLLRLHISGLAVGGPHNRGEHLIVDASGLPDADSGPAGVGVAYGQPNHETALALIAARYAWGHGPASASDLARWTGLSISVSARALRHAVELSHAAVDAQNGRTYPGSLVWVKAVYDGDVEINVEPCAHPPVGKPHSPGGTGMHGFYVMRADLLDILSANRAQAESVFYLPSFDELHVGFKNRLSLTDAAGEKLICPTNNGMFRPLCVVGGRVVAVNPVNKGLLWAQDVKVTAALERRVREQIDSVQRMLSLSHE